MRSIRNAVAVVFFLSASLTLLAQSDNGSVVGFVKDPSGAFVPKAKVTLTNEATGLSRVTSTNDAGYYVVPNVPSGSYTMTAEASGFKKFEATGNKLDPNSILTVDAALQVGAATEKVEVVASATTLQTESAAVEKLVTRSQIDSLELNGRDPLFLASLQPGVRSGSTMGDFSFSLTNGGYAVNGARSNDTEIFFDGAPALRTRGNSTSIGVADVDSTQEVQIMTADYDAEYGQSSGGQIRIVTKGGSAQFHGGAYEYFRNSDMNANTWSRNQSVTTNFASPFRYNQFGFNVGGPVIIPRLIPKGKMFFFVGQEWVRYRNAQTQTQEVPSLLMRQGNFSELLGPNIYYSTPKIIYDPMTCPSVGAASCVPFSGQHHSAGAPKPQWHGDSQPLSDADARLSQRQSELDRRALAARKPAQGDDQLRHSAYRQGQNPVPAHRLSLTSSSIRSIRAPISRPKSSTVRIRPNRSVGRTFSAPRCSTKRAPPSAWTTSTFRSSPRSRLQPPAVRHQLSRTFSRPARICPTKRRR